MDVTCIRYYVMNKELSSLTQRNKRFLKISYCFRNNVFHILYTDGNAYTERDETCNKPTKQITLYVFRLLITSDNGSGRVFGGLDICDANVPFVAASISGL
jgi:hypothetical protein